MCCFQYFGESYGFSFHCRCKNWDWEIELVSSKGTQGLIHDENRDLIRQSEWGVSTDRSPRPCHDLEGWQRLAVVTNNPKEVISTIKAQFSPRVWWDLGSWAGQLSSTQWLRDLCSPNMCFATSHPFTPSHVDGARSQREVVLDTSSPQAGHDTSLLVTFWRP